MLDQIPRHLRDDVLLRAAGQLHRVLAAQTADTGIGQVKAGDSESRAYTLNGNLAQAGHKGIIIKNGKKIIR